MNLEAYISGYADGEGCFCITFNRSRRHSFGWDIRPSFSVSQNSDRAQILELIRKTFGCGTIRSDRSDRTLKYEVRGIADLLEHVIPHFKRYPILSSKQRDFEIFAEVCEMMGRREHSDSRWIQANRIEGDSDQSHRQKEIPSDRDNGIVYAPWKQGRRVKFRPARMA